jgi:hypothetical protein
MFDMLSRLDSSCDYVPPMYEGMKCYQFELENIKPLSKTQTKASSSFFGGLLGKFTGK